MTAKMKRSEFKRIHRVTQHSLHHQAEMAARLAEDAGVEWLPEEPELPERLRVLPPAPDATYRLWPHDDKGYPSGTGERILREAAAYYNAGKRLEDEWYGQPGLGRFKVILDKEREKLRTP